MPQSPWWRVLIVRQAFAIALILAAGAYPLVRAMQEPSLGLRFKVDGNNQVVAELLGSQNKGDAPLALYGVTHISSGSDTVAIAPNLLLESAGVAHRYEEHARFYAEQRRIWSIVQGDSVAIAHQGGVALVQPEPRSVTSLGARFWIPWAMALMSLSIGLGVWLYTPERRLGRLYALAAIGFTWIVVVLACSGSRLLTQDPSFWHWSHKLAHLAGYIQNCSLALILWYYPTRLGNWRFGAGLVAWSAVWLAINWLELVDTISIGFRLPTSLFGPLFWMLLLLQWRAARADAVKRAQLKWLSLLFVGAFAVVFVAYVYAANSVIAIQVPQAYGFAFMALLYIGLVPLVSKLHVFALERWWIRAWLWFMGGLLVVAFDLVLITVFSLAQDMAVMLSLALAGWVYFPLRQWLWQKLAQGNLPNTRDILPDVVALSSTDSTDAETLNLRWRALWERMFEPQVIRIGAAGHETACATDLGQSLQIPAHGLLMALELHLPKRGARLFNTEDATRATEVLALVKQGLSVQEAHQLGVHEERRRIASDLHDDLGARLLQIAQSTSPKDTANLARLALEDMRLSVRGLTSGPTLLADLLADWRSEVVSRAQAAGLAVQWSAPEPAPALRVPPQTAAQVTRVLREATTNVIKHANAKHLFASIDAAGGALTIEIGDDGIGQDFSPALATAGAPFPAPTSNHGHGLLGMERRVRNLGGHMRVGQRLGGGTTVAVSLPTQNWTQATNTAADMRLSDNRI